MIEEGRVESQIPLVRNGFKDAISEAVRGSHDERYLIPNLSCVAASVEEMVYGFFCLFEKYT